MQPWSACPLLCNYPEPQAITTRSANRRFFAAVLAVRAFGSVTLRAAPYSPVFTPRRPNAERLCRRAARRQQDHQLHATGRAGTDHESLVREFRFLPRRRRCSVPPASMSFVCRGKMLSSGRCESHPTTVVPVGSMSVASRFLRARLPSRRRGSAISWSAPAAPPCKGPFLAVFAQRGAPLRAAGAHRHSSACRDRSRQRIPDVAFPHGDDPRVGAACAITRYRTCRGERRPCSARRTCRRVTKEKRTGAPVVSPVLLRQLSRRAVCRASAGPPARDRRR